MRDCYTRDWATRLYRDKEKPCRENGSKTRVGVNVPQPKGFAEHECEGLPSFTLCHAKTAGRAIVARRRYGQPSLTIEERLAIQKADLAAIDAARVRALDPMGSSPGSLLAFEERDPSTGKGQTVTLQTSRYQREVWQSNAAFRRKHDRSFQASESELDKERERSLAREARKAEKEERASEAERAREHRANKPVDVDAFIAARERAAKPGDTRVIKRAR